MKPLFKKQTATFTEHERRYRIASQRKAADLVSAAFFEPGSLVYDHGKKLWVLKKNGTSAGKALFRRIINDPDAMKKIKAVSTEHMARAKNALQKLERLLDENAPLGRMIPAYLECFYESRLSGLDHFLDFEAFKSAMRSCLGPRFRNQVDEEITRIIFPPNGDTAKSVSDRAILLFLAQKFGRHRGDAAGFGKYNMDWVRRNLSGFQVGRSKQIRITEEFVTSQIQKTMKFYGIREGDFEGVVEKLDDMRRERIGNASIHRRLKKNLLKKTLKEKQRTARGLIQFAETAAQNNEEIHVLNRKSMNMLIIAADRRKMSRSQLMKILAEAATEPQRAG